MTHGEFLTAHAILDERAAHSPEDTCELFRRTACPPKTCEHCRARQPLPARRAGAPPSFDRIRDRDDIRAAGHDWRVIAGYGHSPEHASLFAEARGVLISGDMLLPKISTNVSVWPSDPDGDPLGRFLDSLTAFESLPPRSAGAALARTSVPRHPHAGRAAARAS